MAYEQVLAERNGAVLTITLNDPDTRNALGWPLVRDLTVAIDDLGDARAVVITGAGKGFSSGGKMSGELKPGQTLGQALESGLNEHLNPLILKLARLPVPVIAAVNGAAAGAGASLALAADFVVAGESAFFFIAFAQMGLVPDAGATWILPRLIGKARATEMMMLAERVPAAKALEWGLIHKVVSDDNLLGEAGALAARLAAGPTQAYRLMKRNLADALESDLAAALALESGGQRQAGETADSAEAVAAFLGKRAPEFKGV